jgi:hypothetical protein
VLGIASPVRFARVSICLSSFFEKFTQQKKASAKARPAGKRPKEGRKKKKDRFAVRPEAKPNCMKQSGIKQEKSNVRNRKKPTTHNRQPTTNFLLLTIYFYNEIDYD